MKPAKRIKPPKTCSIANSLTKRVNFAKHIAQGVFARLKSVIRHCALERYLRQLAPSFTPWVEFDQSRALNKPSGRWKECGICIGSAIITALRLEYTHSCL